ncbi:MAG: hypothetical protein CL769_02585 [Chloroflexi bacterium]|nr:hypothetical protein [Chloroflexota bacterium]|tara:strand:- start:1869 stop:2744 length:876 start_codon:yes stop_codon:yes gene_type:complete
MFSIGEICALLSAFFWGNSGVLLKSLPSKVRASFIYFESIISGTILIILISIFGQWGLFKEFTLLTFLLCVTASLINLTGSLSYIFTIKHVKVGMAFVVINSLFPLFSIFGSVIFFSESLSIMIYLGAILILLGIASITFRSRKNLNFVEEGSNLKIALFFCIATPLCWATGALLMDDILKSASVMPVTLIRATTTFMICTPIYLLLKRNEFVMIKSKFNMLFFASLLTTFASLGWFTSLELSEAALTVILGSSAPIFALIGARIYLKEKIDKNGVIGILFCFAGVLIVII